MKIKSVWCEIEREDGTSLHAVVPFNVFRYHFHMNPGGIKPGYESDEEIEKMQNWEPAK